MMRLQASVAAAAALAAISCGGQQARPCLSDGDCGRGASCDLTGLCIAPESARPADLRANRVPVVPRADTTVASASCCVTSAYGSHDLLIVGSRGHSSTYRAYISFDLAPLGSQRVGRASLRLVNAQEHNVGDDPIEILAYSAARPWGQGTLTWLRQPGGEGRPWGSTVVRPFQAGSANLDVTGLVAAWVSGAVPNRGLMLRAAREGRQGLLAWYSSDSPDPSRRPLLEVEVQ